MDTYLYFMFLYALIFLFFDIVFITDFQAQESNQLKTLMP